MIRICQFCLGVWLTSLLLVTHAGPLLPTIVTQEDSRVPVWQFLRVVVPGDPNASPAQAATLAEGPGAATVDSPNRILGRGTQPHWALFAVQSAGQTDLLRLLTLEATTQYDVQLFIQAPSGSWHTVPSVAESGRGRFATGSMHPAWELMMRADRPTYLLLRLAGPSLVRFPLYINSPIAFASEQSKTHMGVGATIGICLLVCIYILWVRQHLNDRAVLLILGMILADLVGALWLSGYLAELAPDWPEYVRSAIGTGAYGILFGCGMLHARIHLDTIIWLPRADRALAILGWAWLGVAFWLSFAMPVGARILVLWGGAAVALALVAIAMLAWARGASLPGYIAAAWLVYLLAGIAFALPRLIDNPRLWLPNVAALLLSAVVAVVFGFSLGMRLRLRRQILMADHQRVTIQQATTEALMQERSLYFAATSHDLRQPLLGMRLYADLAKSADTPQERALYAGKIEMALGEIDDFLIDMQQLAAHGQSSALATFDDVSLDGLLMPLVEEYRILAALKTIGIRYVPTRIAVRTSVHHFRRIVRNALSNAVHYTDDGGKILIGCRRGNPVCVDIFDTGRGMTQEQIKIAFNSFQRFDAQMLHPDGFGLGLFSTESLANAVSLTITLDSQLGRGTRFRIKLPSSTVVRHD